ncbi:osteopetrosis-associated transmembrane protein 1 [Rhagoletis pomonella]|uniref:osteopetrosis-associated transmembrane protein 1 n=1 Tax=Rhagoletis pomonella TaxID=28610 RepID=UPI0017855B47|nr:osteopetrosis-associated transmembrane protein 1 [Rhagoletis pomonella]
MNMHSASFAAGLLLLLSSTPSGLAENICQKYLRELAQNQSVFVQCSTKHSVPVSLCVGCEEPFTDMHLSYMALRNEKNCTDIYFDKDRINIVSTTQSILVGLWTKAYCDDCYSNNHSYVFDLKKRDFEDCLREHKGEECSACLLEYLDLNGFYISLDKKNNGKICFDMQDAMNRTRAHWSKDLKCCHREFDYMLFLVVCGFIAILPILFYGTTFFLTKHQERNYVTIIEDPRSSNDGPSTNVNANSSSADLPSTSSVATCPRVPSPKTKLQVEGFTSSDDSDLEETAAEITSKKHDKSE